MSDFRRITDSFLASAQIAPADLAEARRHGIALVINNRPDAEEPGQPCGADIAAAAARHGIDYRAIPVTHAGIGADQITAMAEALAGAGGPVLAYCRSGTRSTLLWALAQASAGADPDALAQAAQAGGYDLAPVRAGLEQLAARARE